MTPYLDLAEKLRPAFLRLGRRIRQEPSEGLSPLDASILIALRKNAGQRLTDLARSEGMAIPSMSAHVRRLEIAGLLHRAPATEGDRRAIEISLTPQGEFALRLLRKLRNDWLITQLKLLNADELEAISNASAALQRLSGYNQP